MILNVFKYKHKRSKKLLDKFLSKRKSIQKNKSSTVEKILRDVKKNGDKSVLHYEKKFSKIKVNSVKVFFTKKELTNIANKTDKKIYKS